MQDTGDLPPATKVCNCCQCKCLLLGTHEAAWWNELDARERRKWPPMVAGRLDGRPYCAGCLKGKRRGVGRAAVREDGDSPGQQDALRAWEDSEP